MCNRCGKCWTGTSIALLVVALAGCSSDSSTAPTTEPTRTTDPVTTTADTTTSSTTTTASSTTTTSTTLAPTTTTTPIEQQIKDAIQAYDKAYFACGLDPANCDVALIAAAGSVAEEKGRSAFAEMARRGLYPDANAPLSRLVTTKVVVNSDTQATADTCVFDDSRLLGPPGPDGQPAVIADGNESYTMRQIWVLEAGAWKLRQEDRLETLGEGDLCGH